MIVDMLLVLCSYYDFFLNLLFLCSWFYCVVLLLLFHLVLLVRRLERSSMIVDKLFV